jgi:hypothetical protein
MDPRASLRLINAYSIQSSPLDSDSPSFRLCDGGPPTTAPRSSLDRTLRRHCLVNCWSDAVKMAGWYGANPTGSSARQHFERSSLALLEIELWGRLVSLVSQVPSDYSNLYRQLDTTSSNFC